MMLDEPRPRQGGRHHLGTVAGFKSEWTAGIGPKVA
jgi:hypothetical protein